MSQNTVQPSTVDHATLQVDRTTVDLPISHASIGSPVIELAALSHTGCWTLDKGLSQTATCESKITYIDGAQGTLLYRGYPIEQLADQADYIETCFLLLNGELPSVRQKQQFVNQLQSYNTAHPHITALLEQLPKNAHPMAMLMSATTTLTSTYPVDPNDLLATAQQLIAQAPILAAHCYRQQQGLPFIAPKASLGYAENFLHMLFATDDDHFTIDPLIARAMDRIFTLHADHEQNASTTVVRATGSTGSHPFACIASGIAALWGAAHGGANEACLKMLQTIGDITNIELYIAKAKDKEDPFRLMGFGHRVYKNYDPRAKVMRQTAHEVLHALGRQEEPLFKLAMALEQVALQDPYFVDKKLYPNVDFYSGITLSALGIPTNLFTVIFALARTVGWAAHWIEMQQDPGRRITRPRQLYTGPVARSFVPIDQRTD